MPIRFSAFLSTILTASTKASLVSLSSFDLAFMTGSAL